MMIDRIMEQDAIAAIDTPNGVFAMHRWCAGILFALIVFGGL